MKRRKLTFQQQTLIGIGLIVLSAVLSHLFHHGGFHRVAWIVYGLMFLLNPVWPQSWAHADPRKMKAGCYLAGVICILVGIWTRFGI